MRRSLARLGKAPRRIAAIGSLTLALGAGDAGAADLLIRNARLIDGTGAPPRTGVSIRVRDGRIAAIAPELGAEGVPVLDVADATVLPGLIDVHVHLSEVPGEGHRRDPPEVRASLITQHLAAYVACGVTTVLDAGIDPGHLRQIRSMLAAGSPGPRFLTLGPGLFTHGGLLSPPLPGIATVADVDRVLDLAVDVGAVGAAVWLEHGWAGVPRWPIHPPAIRDAIVRGAAERGLPIYVHATSEEGQSIALDMGAHAMLQSFLFRFMPPSDAFATRMAATGTYQATTFATTDSQLVAFHPERLDDPLVQLTVPALERATARDPETQRALGRDQMPRILPWLPAFLRASVAERILDENTRRSGFRMTQEAIQRLHAAGVPIVVGSDAGGSPYHLHGPMTLREVELLGEAGLTPMEAIAAATRMPAAMLGLGDEIGTVEVGKRADLVVVRDDPLGSLAALRTVRWTVRDGVARTPAQWMNVAEPYQPGTVRSWSETRPDPTGPRAGQFVMAALSGIPLLVWAVVTRRAWRYLRTHRPRSSLPRILALAGGLVVAHYLLAGSYQLTWVELQWRALGALLVFFVVDTLLVLGAVSLFHHLVRLAPVRAEAPGRGWLAVNYGSMAVVGALSVLPVVIPGPSWELRFIAARLVVVVYLLVVTTAILWQLRHFARRGPWRSAALGEARSADLVLLGGGMVVLLGLLFLLVTGGVLSIWGDVADVALGLVVAAPLAVRLLGEVVRTLLLTGAAVSATAAVYFGVPAVTAALASPSLARLVDVGAVVGLALLLLDGQPRLREAIDYLVFRRSRRHRAELLEALSALSPELGSAECCRRALAEVVRVMGLRGAALMLRSGERFAHGAVGLDVLERAWPRDEAATALPAKAVVGWYELSEFPPAVREALVEANVVGVVPVASPGRRWGCLLVSTGLVGAAFGDEDLETVEAFAARLAIALDAADLLARTLAVERSLAHAEKLAAIGELSARIAHEIRNPVTAARSLAQQLARAPAAPADAEAAHVILTELERVERQVAALLRFARREDFVFEPVDLGELARATVASFRDRCEAAEVAAVVETATGVVVRADRDKMRQVLINLVENALDALADASRPRTLSVAVANGDGRATVRVSDSGAGVPADALPHLFDPFFSLKPRGTGLGLAIARRTVEAHGGRIEASPAPARGMTFQVELPLAAGGG